MPYRIEGNLSELRSASDKILITLSSNIRRLRKDASISQETLADMCGVHRTYIGSIERCERNVTLSTLELLSSAFGISIIELLRAPDDKETPDS